MNYFFKYIAIPIIITAATTFGIQNYVPLDWIDFLQTPKFGSTITTINGSDTISGSRTTINTNFTNLNAGKIENSTTSVAAITTLNNLTSASSLATIGTITSGTWNGTAIGVDKGGTGTTTPAFYRVILGNSTYGLTVASTTGTSGQFLTSNGAGAYPSWQSSTVNQTDSYNFTGTYFGVKNLYASSTVANPIYLNGIDYNLPATEGASSTMLTTNGSGNLVWELPMRQLSGTTTDYEVNDTASTTVFSTIVPANYLINGNTIHAKLNVIDFGLDSGYLCYIEVLYDDTIMLTTNLTSAANNNNGWGWVTLDLISNGTASQEVYINLSLATGQAVWNMPSIAFPTVLSGTATEDATSAKTLSVRIRINTIGSYGDFTVGSSYSYLIK